MDTITIVCPKEPLHFGYKEGGAKDLLRSAKDPASHETAGRLANKVPENSPWQRSVGKRGATVWINRETGVRRYQEFPPVERGGDDDGSKEKPKITWGDIVTNQAPHVRVVGDSGSGKTTLAQALAVKMDGQLFIIDPVFQPKHWGGLSAAKLTPDGSYDEISKALAGLIKELNRRMAKLQTGDTEFQRLNVIFDEVPTTVSELPKEAGAFIKRLAQIGRQVDIHLVGIAQSSRVEAWGIAGHGDVAENFATIYLGKKAYERNENLAGKDNVGILEWKGQDRVIDMSSILEKSKEPIDKDRLFKIEESAEVEKPVEKNDEKKDEKEEQRMSLENGQVALGKISFEYARMEALYGEEKARQMLRAGMAAGGSTADMATALWMSLDKQQPQQQVQVVTVPAAGRPEPPVIHLHATFQLPRMDPVIHINQRELVLPAPVVNLENKTYVEPTPVTFSPQLDIKPQINLPPPVVNNPPAPRRGKRKGIIKLDRRGEPIGIDFEDEEEEK